MSEKGKDRLFIAYANYSLRVDPKNFIRIFDVGDRYFSFLSDERRRTRQTIEAIVECEFSKKAFVEHIISKKPDPNVKIFYAAGIGLREAIEAVHGYRDGFCENECPSRKGREEKWGREPFEGSARWKCIECDQFDFVRVLMDIMDGIPYSEIEGLLIPSLSSDEGSSKFGFREYWNTLIGDDLGRFLNEDDNNWRRLKLCPYCYEFFIARDAKKKWCYSSDCKREYHKRDMQERRKRER